MRVSFKKTLATLLSIALVLSTCICALTVGAAATVVGRIDIFDNENIVSEDSTFEVPATITLNNASEFVEVAFSLDLPAGFTLNSVVAQDPSIATVSVDTKKVISISARGPVESIALVMTIAKTVSEFDAFELGVAKLEFADVSEADLTLDITDTGRISLYVEHGASDAYAFDDNNHWNTCVAEGCTDKFNEAPHNWVAGEKVDATCTTAGSQDYSCVCGATKTEEIAVLDHVAGEPVKEKEVLPTCTTEGSYDMVTYCTVCEEELNRVSTTVPTTDHTPLAAAKENEVAATCAAAGSYDMVVRCAECSEVISSESFVVEALAHEYQYADNGDGNHTKTCKNCDTVNVVEAHTYVDGTCACGAVEVTGPIVDDELVVAGATVGFGTSSLELNFRMRNTVLTKYAKTELVIIPDKYDKSTLNLVEEPEEIVVPYSDFTVAGSFRTYKYTEMMLYELALDVNYMLRAYDAEGNVVAVSETYNTSAVGYLKTLLGNSNTAANLKTVIVDMLIVCEEARKAMAKTGTQLETDSKVSLLTDVDTSLASPSVGEYNTVNKFDTVVSGWGLATSDAHRVATSVAMEKVPVITIRLKDSSKVLDLNKLVMKVSYTSVGSAGYVEKTITGADFTRSGNYIISKFTDVGLHDSKVDIKFEFSYDGAETGTLTYSIETFLGSKQNDASIGALSVALIKLGASFRTLKGY